MKDNKDIVALIMQKMHGKDKGESEEMVEPGSDKLSIAQELIDAVKADDAQGVVDALEALAMCEDEPMESDEDESTDKFM